MLGSVAGACGQSRVPACELIVYVSVSVKGRVCLCVYAIGAGRGPLLLPQACPVGFRPRVWGWEGKREGWILDPFLGFPMPPGKEKHWLLRLVLFTLSGCPQTLSCVIWDHVPTKGGNPGPLSHFALATEPRAEPIRSGRRIAELLIGRRMGRLWLWAEPRCRPDTGHVLPCSARRVGGVGVLEPVLPQLRAGVPEPDADLRAPPARRQGLRGSRAAD